MKTTIAERKTKNNSVSNGNTKPESFKFYLSIPKDHFQYLQHEFMMFRGVKGIFINDSNDNMYIVYFKNKAHRDELHIKSLEFLFASKNDRTMTGISKNQSH